MRKQRRSRMFCTLRLGLTSFQDMDVERKSRLYTSQSVNEDGHRSLIDGLRENKKKFTRLRTEVSVVREEQLAAYITKSAKYQQLLSINDTKKKRLPTLNAKVGQVVKKTITDTLPKNISYSVLSTTHKITAWKPQSREGHTTTAYKNVMVLIGGHCSVPFDQVLLYSLESNGWERQMVMGSARSYHSAVLYKNRFIIVYGGMGGYDVSRRCRVCYSSICLVDMQSCTVRGVKIEGEEEVEARRSHTATLMGKYMVVFGGINTKKEYLNDFVYLDLKELRWYAKEYKVEGKELGQALGTGLAKHKAIAVFRAGRKNYPLYSSEYSDNEGILLFGGLFGSGEENTLLQFTFNRYNPVVRKVEYLGVPPSSVEPLVERLNEQLIVVVSGEQSYRELWLYKIKEREFLLVHDRNIAQHLGGIGSSVCKHEQEIYVFFGVGEKGYLSDIEAFFVEEKIVEHEAIRRNKGKSIAWRNNMEESSDQQYR